MKSKLKKEYIDFSKKTVRGRCDGYKVDVIIYIKTGLFGRKFRLWLDSGLDSGKLFLCVD
jgi:hypothetical protein